MVLRSCKFNDVYFSAEDGLAETRHVFIDGNGLLGAWADKPNYVIAETGFGTGLNFLAAWMLFEETAKPWQRLHFISVEKYPLPAAEIREALSGWTGALGGRLERMLALYPLRVPGPHTVDVTDRVRLTLWFGDIGDVLPEWTGCVDAWFLDGFAPAKNPDMWSPLVFATMARLAHSATSYASFTAAGAVRQGLAEAGFGVEKIKGFGTKRDMVRGVYRGGGPRPAAASLSVAVIGAGISGCAVADACGRAGMQVTVYEAGSAPASEASGGRLGMINPRLTAIRTAQSDYFTAAYAHALRVLQDIDDIDFSICGSLHLCTDADKDRRFQGYLDNLGWHPDHLVREEGTGHLLYPDGAVVSPSRLCHALAERLDIKFGAQIERLGDIAADIVILACGIHAPGFMAGGGDILPIRPVRGQVSWLKARPGITQNFCYGGYVTPPVSGGFHILGSTFQPWDESPDIREADHMTNIAALNDAIGALSGTGTPATMDDIVGGWVGFRASARDRFPVAGKIPPAFLKAEDGRPVYMTGAHGSHGIISGLMAARIVAAEIAGEHVPAGRAVLSALSPERFHKRRPSGGPSSRT